MIAAALAMAAPFAVASSGHPAVDACLSPALAGAVANVRSQGSASPSAYAVTRELVLGFGARPAGSESERAAAIWAASKLRSLKLDRVETQAFAFDGWERGSAALEWQGEVPVALRVAALGGSTATPPEGLRGQLVRFSSLTELDAAPVDAVAGRIVFLDVRMRRARDRSGYQEAVVVRRDGATHVARKRGIGLVIRSIGTDDERAPHAGWSRGAADVARIPAVAASNADADFLAEALAGRVSANVLLRSSARTSPGLVSRNVIGQIDARASTRETVLLGAHLDSWDLGTGAEDDGAGVGVVVSAMERLLPYRGLFRRNVRVVLFGAEELGGLGAEDYAKRSAAMAHHVVAAESDLGSGRPWRLQMPDPARPRAVDRTLADALAPFDLAASSGRAFGGTDVEPLSAEGTAFYDIDPDATNYFDVHHSERDTLGRVSRPGLEAQSAAFATLALIMASAPDDCLQPAAAHR